MKELEISLKQEVLSVTRGDEKLSFVMSTTADEGGASAPSGAAGGDGESFVSKEWLNALDKRLSLRHSMLEERMDAALGDHTRMMNSLAKQYEDLARSLEAQLADIVEDSQEAFWNPLKATLHCRNKSPSCAISFMKIHRHSKRMMMMMIVKGWKRIQSCQRQSYSQRQSQMENQKQMLMLMLMLMQTQTNRMNHKGRRVKR